MVGVTLTGKACFPLIYWLCSLFLVSNFIAQNVIKPDMKIKLRMEGAVNGHKFLIIGKGEGKPYE